MNARRLSRYPLFLLLAAIFLLLSACQLAGPATSTQPTAAAPVTEEPQDLTQPTLTSSGALAELTLDTSTAAQNFTSELIPAVANGADVFWTAVMPQHRLLTLQGYPVSNHTFKPQIFLYPVSELASANENAARAAADLQYVLQTQQAGDTLPFLPLENAAQVMRSQEQYLDFKSGKGIRFLTQFNQGLVPINNSGLIYTFQGLTSDGKYYVAAVLPVTHPELPAGPEITDQQVTAITDDPGYYPNAVANTAAMLNQQPANSFTPDLNALDAMIRSIEVK